MLGRPSFWHLSTGSWFNFFFHYLKLFVPCQTTEPWGAHLDKQEESLGPHFQRATGLVQRSLTTYTTSGSNAQVSAWTRRARWLSFLHPYPLQWPSWIMSCFHPRQCPCLDPVLFHSIFKLEREPPETKKLSSSAQLNPQAVIIIDLKRQLYFLCHLY